ncbi:MAG: hypothetical protein UT40_C0009G0014 [Candidatus Woesebacteria bacterium GW2011_GWA1_39_21b]|uniref:Uncharacterized protein n=2 Tax=Patescibacteria group TaxID=1783273 RepID=A0A1G2QB40_9BACT|nr:MAG: hypothetical protein UT40_C0009G0014 [Candidatus Woesebacteria bacterium GW2011_GWA1_39_21b]KKS77458.1 MAG: hypothetical protein UV50_C0005G0013 [Parcubacteria group bacterium GW2011_GWB1_42_9]KKS88980.1 MAG: hypothetical protein UV64_C0015G0008 [Parcubacteria group bacterium GW2011_GWC1_43_11b]OHA57775.1 MAG: hypothetical protein A2370_02545 [Candidatus Vogelbacteria bacterium RIFOXYB1_FULL_42_16]
MKFKIFFLLLVGVALFSFLFFFVLFPVKAQSTIVPFGGVTLAVIPCVNGVLLVTQRPVTGPEKLIFDPSSSRLYPYFKLVPGSSGKHILGIASTPSVCNLVYKHVVAPKIIMIGTSE